MSESNYCERFAPWRGSARIISAHPDPRAGSASWRTNKIYTVAPRTYLGSAVAAWRNPRGSLVFEAWNIADTRQHAHHTHPNGRRNRAECSTNDVNKDGQPRAAAQSETDRARTKLTDRGRDRPSGNEINRGGTRQDDRMVDRSARKFHRFAGFNETERDQRLRISGRWGGGRSWTRVVVVVVVEKSAREKSWNGSWRGRFALCTPWSNKCSLISRITAWIGGRGSS